MMITGSSMQWTPLGFKYQGTKELHLAINDSYHWSTEGCFNVIGPYEDGWSDFTVSVCTATIPGKFCCFTLEVYRLNQGSLLKRWIINWLYCQYSPKEEMDNSTGMNEHFSRGCVKDRKATTKEQHKQGRRRRHSFCMFTASKVLVLSVQFHTIWS